MGEQRELQNIGFLAGTEVHTSSGLVCIERINIGDDVWTRNTEGERQSGKVREIHCLEHCAIEPFGFATESDLEEFTYFSGISQEFWVIGAGWTHS